MDLGFDRSFEVFEQRFGRSPATLLLAIVAFGVWRMGRSVHPREFALPFKDGDGRQGMRQVRHGLG
jgi:hypothetical protein